MTIFVYTALEPFIYYKDTDRQARQTQQNSGGVIGLGVTKI